MNHKNAKVFFILPNWGLQIQNTLHHTKVKFHTPVCDRWNGSCIRWWGYAPACGPLYPYPHWNGMGTGQGPHALNEEVENNYSGFFLGASIKGGVHGPRSSQLINLDREELDEGAGNPVVSDSKLYLHSEHVTVARYCSSTWNKMPHPSHEIAHS